jgi:hypothetical protein
VRGNEGIPFTYDAVEKGLFSGLAQWLEHLNSPSARHFELWLIVE